MLPRAVLALAAAGALWGQAPAPADPGQLESRLESNPADIDARSRLLTYYLRAGTTDPDRVKPLRRKHILYVIEHHPESFLAGELAAAIDPSGSALADPEGYQLAEAAWKRRFASEPQPEAVYSNAVGFFRVADPGYARHLVAEGLARYPGIHPLSARKGALDALAILGARHLEAFGDVAVYDDAIARSGAAAEGRRELESTASPYLLAGAAAVLERQSNSLRTHPRAPLVDEVMALAERCWLRAIELDPKNPAWPDRLQMVYTSMAAAKRTPEERLAVYEKAAAIPGAERLRWQRLTDLADAQFAVGALDKAAAAARETLEIAPRYRTDWDYGNAIHKANIVLGQIALKRNDAAEQANS